MMPRSALLQFAALAYQVASRHLPVYGSKFAPKKFTQPTLLACLLIKEYLRLDYRGLEALLASAAELRTALGLTAVPDHSMVHWFLRHKVSPTLLKAVRKTTLQLFTRRYRRGRRIVAVDATGFARRVASRYYVARLHQWRHRYLLSSLVVWTKPQVICAQADRVGPGSQSRLLKPLVQQTQADLPIDRLLADADYDSEPHHRWLREDCGIESIIPPIRGRPGRPKPGTYRARLRHWFPRRKYGLRWMAETVNSVIKRKFGDTLTARRPWQQIKQASLRGITYNLYRAVRLGLLVWRWLIHQVVTVVALQI